MRAAGACPLCGVAMVAAKPGETKHQQDTMTRDHILPRVRGGAGVMHGSVRNIRFVCQRCNLNRAVMFHCVGIMACLGAIAEDSKVSLEAIGRRTGVILAGARNLTEEAKAKPPCFQAPWRRKRPKPGGAQFGATLGDAWPGAQA